MTLQMNHSVIICDETHRKLVVNAFPKDEIFHMKFGAITVDIAYSRTKLKFKVRVRPRMKLITSENMTDHRGDNLYPQETFRCMSSNVCKKT